MRNAIQDKRVGRNTWSSGQRALGFNAPPQQGSRNKWASVKNDPKPNILGLHAVSEVTCWADALRRKKRQGNSFTGEFACQDWLAHRNAPSYNFVSVLHHISHDIAYHCGAFASRTLSNLIIVQAPALPRHQFFVLLAVDVRIIYHRIALCNFWRPDKNVSGF